MKRNELCLHNMIKTIACLLISGSMLNMAMAENQVEFPLKDGETWVMVGDSITFQHLHSNYIEAFCFARFPSWNIHFRNAGKPSDTVPWALQRFDRDVEPWKPTIISVELGMNERGRHPGDTYLSDLTNMTERIRALGARPVYFTSSAVNDGTIATNRSDKNQNLDKRAASLKAFAAAQKAPVADQCRLILQKVDDKERIVTQWRTLSATCDKQPSNSQRNTLEQLNKQVLEADAEIRKAAQPKVHHFTLSPVK